MTDDPMRLWRAFEKTDPAHTKLVNFGRKFTAIDAQWQIQLVTSVLGPVGHGWHYSVVHSIEKISDTLTIAIADVSIGWGDRSESGFLINGYGPVRGMVELWYQKTDKGRLVTDVDGKPVMAFDDDAGKKAMTDALTKALSHLGVSADVFMGRFDDSKYVEKMQREFTAKKLAGEPLPEFVTKALAILDATTNLSEMETAVGMVKANLTGWEQHHLATFGMRVKAKRASFPKEEPAASA